MNRKDFMQLLSAGFSDPKLLARATSDYYTRCKERLTEKINVIASALTGENASIEDQFICLQHYDDNGNLYPISLNVQDVKQSIVSIISDPSNGELVSYEDLTIECHDYYSDTMVNITINDISGQLGTASDSLTLAIESFNAMASEGINSAADFINRVKVTIPNMTEQTTQVCSDIYSLISNSANSIYNTYELVSEYFGIKQNLGRTAEDDFQIGSPAIEQYTGINPTVALYSSLDWMGPLKWLGTFYKFQVDAIVGVGKFLWNGIKRVGNWFVKSVSETFVNPVDVSTEGDTYEFFKEYSTMRYDLENMTEGGLRKTNFIIKIKEFFDDENGKPRPIWFSMKTLSYQMSYQINNLGHYELLINRYVKPTNIEKFYELLYAAGYNDNVPTSVSYWENFSLVDFCRLLQDTDLSCSKDASEKEIAASLVLTNLIDRWLGGVFSLYTCFPYNFDYGKRNFVEHLNQFMMTETNDIPVPDLASLWIRKYKGAFVYDSLYYTMGIWTPDSYSTGTDESGNPVTYLGNQTELLNRILNDQVTNNDMLQLVCNFGGCDFGSTHPTIKTPFNLQAGADWNVIYPNDVFYSFHGSTDLAFNLLITHLLFTEEMQITASNGTSYNPDIIETYDGVYLTYSRSNLNIGLNANVKSDEQNIEAARNWMVTAIIIVGAIAAAIYLGVRFNKAVKTIRTRQALIDNNMRTIGNMMSSGAPQKDIDKIYADTRSLIAKNKILSKLYGTAGMTTTTVINNSLADLSLPTTRSNPNLDPIITLIH